MMALMSSPLPEWMYPPREEGWFAEDLDRLPEAPRHTELLHGALVFRLWPQKLWHSEVVTNLTVALNRQAPAGTKVLREITIRLDERNRLEPDVVATTGSYDRNDTWLGRAGVVLVVEVTSPESAHRDRTAKLRKYAEAGIPYYWIVDKDSGEPVVHLYQLDRGTGAYVATGVARDRLQTSLPFPIDIDLTSLA